MPTSWASSAWVASGAATIAATKRTSRGVRRSSPVIVISENRNPAELRLALFQGRDLHVEGGVRDSIRRAAHGPQEVRRRIAPGSFDPLLLERELALQAALVGVSLRQERVEVGIRFDHEAIQLFGLKRS